MPRRRRMRRIAGMPRISHFAPIGGPSFPDEINLNLDEFEAIRLKDFEGKDQEMAAKEMNISQPTFHRLILAARKKVADALVNNKIVRIKGGSYEMVAPIKTKAMPGRGPVPRGYGRRGLGRGLKGGVGPGGFCICPKCGNRKEKVPGVPCTSTKCDKCGTIMIRE